MPPSFLPITSKVRDDPLGPQTLAALGSNLQFIQALAGAEHMVTGEHNSVQVPRAAVSILWSGASYSISPSSADITAVASPATGTVTLTLAADRFDARALRPQINIKASGIESKPWMYGFQVISATSVKVYLKQLSSSLGSGNSWAAADGSFDIALHSVPLSRGFWKPGQIPKVRGSRLTEAPADWNALVAAHAQMQVMRLVAHDDDGTHNVREVAKEYAHVTFDSGSTDYKLEAQSANVDSSSRSGLGVAEVDFVSALTTPLQAFACPDFLRTSGAAPATGYVIHVKENSSTSVIAYVYRYDFSGHVWNREDCDFFLVVHGG